MKEAGNESRRAGVILTLLVASFVTWHPEHLIAAEGCLAPGVFFKCFPVCYIPTVGCLSGR